MTRVQLHRGPPPSATLAVADSEFGFFGESHSSIGLLTARETVAVADSAVLATTALTPSQQVITYLTALPNQSTHRCIVGQMDDNGAGIELAGINQLQTDTGKMVGLIGEGYTYTKGDLTSISGTAWTTDRALITGICTFKNPQTGGAETDLTAAIHNTVTVGTTAHDNFFGVQLPALVASFNSILAATPGVCLIIRPFREENGNWFWWGNAATADFVSLWQQTYTFLNVTSGLAGHLLFDYNVYVGQGNYTKNYPGDAFVDMVSFDYYGDNPATDCNTTYNNLNTLHKPIHWAEFGPHNATGPIAPNSFDNTVVLNACKTNFPKVFAVSCWNGQWAWDTQNNAATLVNDPIIATAADVQANTRFV
ncbi:MAG TPA: glycosyl hydrolase [Gemmatimonadales bacterium]|nr:glycosyl hydrolase [Gemmatimonadales bacterium]